MGRTGTWSSLPYCMNHLNISMMYSRTMVRRLRVRYESAVQLLKDRPLSQANLSACGSISSVQLSSKRRPQRVYRRDATRQLYRARTDTRTVGRGIPRLFKVELDEEDLKEIRSAANGGFALGNQRSKDEIYAMLGRRVERLRQRLRQRALQSG